MFLFDCHLDLSMNALEWNRDFSRPLDEIRAREAHLKDRPDRGRGTVSFAEMRRGGIGLCVGTQIARYVHRSNPLPGWHSAEQAWAMTQGQLAWYREMEARGEISIVKTRADLEAHLARWDSAVDQSTAPIGMIRSLEGADSIVTLAHLERAWEDGLRAIGPAHYGPGTYAQGTDATGGIGVKGRELLKEMERLNIILDATHLCDDSFWEALENFNGHVWASHNNCRSIVNHNRQFSDEQIKELIRRSAVIGGVMDAWMLVPNWVRGVSTPQSMNCTLEKLLDHMDHICQLAGNTLHVGIGSDLDGAFGKEQSPTDIETIADLQKIPTLLSKRGYNKEDVENITSKNWIRFLRKAWSK